MDKITPNSSEFLQFIKIINDLCGVDLSEKRNFLESKWDSFIKGELHLVDFREFLMRLNFDKAVRQATLDFITVNETYFYRELTQLKQAAFYLKSLEKPASVLCAPCASGEEVYSFAILLALNGVQSVHITGIDINQKAIEKAKTAKYLGRSLKNLPESEKKHFFTQQNDIYEVKKSELCHCRFELCNVFDEKFLKLGKFDIIFSRNMMIYFDYESRLQLLERFYQISNPECRLYIGNSDLVPAENIHFSRVSAPNGGTYYQRNF